MIMTLQNAMMLTSRQSMAAGAASLSDSSMHARAIVVVSLVVGRRDRHRRRRRLVEPSVVARVDLRRAIDAGHEVAKHLLGDEQGVLELDDGVRRRLEQDDVVRAFAVPVDRVGQAAAAPRGDLHDLAAGGDDLAGGAVDDRLALVIRHIRAEDEHEFIAAHARGTPSNGDAPLPVDRRGAERTGRESSTSVRVPRARRPVPRVAARRCILLADPHGRRQPTQSTISGETPVPASTILLLGPTPRPARPSIAAILTGAGYTVTTTSTRTRRFAKAAEQQLVIIDVASGPKRSAVDICREIRATPAMSAIPVMCVSTSEDVEERIHFLEAGADDVMARPFDARELEARVEALLLRFQRSRDLAPIISADGLTLSRARRTVAVYSPKGGVGTTTVATNIAIAAAAHRPDRVVLVDFALQFGGVAVLLNLDPKQTLADVVRDEASLREPELLRTYAMRHDSGLHVLAAPAGTRGGRDDHPGPRRPDPDDAARELRPGRHRRRLDARRAGADDLRDGGERPPADHARRSGRSSRCTPCSSTWARPGPSGSSRRSCSTTCSPATSSSCATSRASSARRWRSSCRTTRSSTSRPSTRACRSSPARRARPRRSGSSSSAPSRSARRAGCRGRRGPRGAQVRRPVPFRRR